MNEHSMNNAVTMRPDRGASLGRIDQYELIRELGGGGFGCVYLARDTVAGIEVAVKGLPPLVRLNKEELENVRKNFALVSRLHHPNIAAALHLQKVENAFYDDKADAEKLRVFNGDTLVVMQYAPGVTLSQWRKQFPDGKVPLDKALEITRQIASALDYAHEEKILHRDIKPANVMIETGGDGKITARVLDFGLAAEIRSSMSRVSQSVTDTSGTRPYMAPEQWLGEDQGKETDLYALAVLFNELVTGKVPFASVFDTGDPVLMMNVVGNREFNPPSEFSKPIRLALSKALAKKREDRFASCSEFVDALQSGRMSGGRASPLGGRASPRAYIFTAVATLGLAIGGVWYWQSESSASNGNTAREDARPPMTSLREADSVRAIPSIDEQKEKAEAERKQREDAERRLREGERPREPQSPDAEDTKNAQKERQQAVAKLEKLRTQITIKIDDAEGRMEKVAAYRGETDGFQKHLDTIDEKWKVVESADSNPSDVADAEAILKSVTEADSIIAQELEWLKTNKSARDGAKAIEQEIVDSLESELNRFKASDYARSTYNDGMRHRKEGNAALESGDFQSAHKELTAAKEKLTVAIKEAKAFCMKTHLDSAELYLSSKKWQMCVDKADKVLEWDANNAKAIELKNAALQHLVPSLKVIATIDGEEVRGAKVKINGKEYSTPLKWEKLEKGASLGPYDFTFTRYGKNYVGTLSLVTVNWLGLKTLTVALKEYTGPRRGDRKTLTLSGGATMTMIYVAPGSFMMGSPSTEEERSGDETQHHVTLTKGYWLGETEVTQAQWESVMGDNPSRFKSATRPVENVSWEDCQKFIAKVNREARRQFGGDARLPTEAEWEYACRAGSRTALSNGKLTIKGKNNGPELDEVAWYGGNSSVGFELSNGYDCSGWPEKQYEGTKAGTHPVAKKTKNPWGFYDMHGNVWEWCQDWYGAYPSGAVTDPTGQASGDNRVLRGGSWNFIARFCRSANRFRCRPGNRLNFYGFRLACSVGPRD